MNITVLEPLADPMIHKAFPGRDRGPAGVRDGGAGAKDHWIKNMNDPDDTRWEYTYHGRLADYGTWKEKAGRRVASRSGRSMSTRSRASSRSWSQQPFTRQAQMITWMPNLDLDCYDPPCLQSIWYRILEDEEDGANWLNCNVRFRSNDAWGASFMNMFGFIMFNREVIAAEVARAHAARR